MRPVVLVILSLILWSCEPVTGPPDPGSGMESELIGFWASEDGETYSFDRHGYFHRTLLLDAEKHLWRGPYMYDGRTLSVRVEWYQPPFESAYQVAPVNMSFYLELSVDGRAFTMVTNGVEVTFHRVG